MKPIKNTKAAKPTLENANIRTNGTTLEIGLAVITNDNHMVVIQVHVGKRHHRGCSIGWWIWS
jgi:hypothetical protein